MRIETTSDHTNQLGGQAISGASPCETRHQAASDAAHVYDRARYTSCRGGMAETNLARLTDACERAQVVLGAYDTRIPQWLAGWEPETCVVVADIVTRAYEAGRNTTVSIGPLTDPYCRAGQHAPCPGRLCRCPRCQYQMEWQ